jgi:ParB/RepB/Spo0J family partition protein
MNTFYVDTMINRELAKMGEQIPAERFHVSELNVRAGRPFGESGEDRALIDQLRRGKIIGPFKVRPESDGYGVVVGRRRFLAKKEAGAKFFVVGCDCLIEEMTDDEAREASLIENLDILRKEMDPITRAERLNEIISFSPAGLRATARRLGIPSSTLSEWLKILELSPKMQDAVAKGLLCYTDALHLAKMNIGHFRQDELADILEKEGFDAFKKALERLGKKRLKRGAPKGKYIILRTTLDTMYPPDMELYDKLKRLAETHKMKLDEYCKHVLTEHSKSPTTPAS